MKTRLAKTLIIIMALVDLTAVNALADDAAIKKQLVGYWNAGGSVYHLQEDGTMDVGSRPEVLHCQRSVKTSQQ